MHEDQENIDDTELESNLIDLAGVSLTELMAVPRIALAQSVCRLLAEADQQPTAFNQYCSTI